MTATASGTTARHRALRERGSRKAAAPVRGRREDASGRGSELRLAPAALRARWRIAFDAAEDAIRAASRFLPAQELRELARSLAAERAATTQALQAYARNELSVPYEHLAMLPGEARRQLGLPAQIAACVFNLDGVLIGSAAIHAEAWTRTFDPFLARRAELAHREVAPFNPRLDYPRHVHGKPRLDGVRDFLASRGISLPEGSPGDPPGAETVHGLANRKKALFVELIERRGLTAFAGAREYLETAHDAHVRCAVVSASANTEAALERAELAHLIDGMVDGNAIVADRLPPRPAPDILLAASRRLDVPPRDTAVFETTPAGIRAARAGSFGLVVGVGRGDAAQALGDAGADVVVASLEELFERRRAA